MSYAGLLRDRDHLIRDMDAITVAHNTGKMADADYWEDMDRMTRQMCDWAVTAHAMIGPAANQAFPMGVWESRWEDARRHLRAAYQSL